MASRQQLFQGYFPKPDYADRLNHVFYLSIVNITMFQVDEVNSPIVASPCSTRDTPATRGRHCFVLSEHLLWSSPLLLNTIDTTKSRQLCKQTDRQKGFH